MLRNAFENLSTEAKQDVIIGVLRDLSDTFGDTATPNTAIALLNGILNAVDGLELSLDDVNLNVDGVESLLQSILTELLQKLEPNDEVELGTATLNALESIAETSENTAAVSKLTEIDNVLDAFKAEAKTESDETQGLLTTIDAVLDDLVSRVGDIATTDTVRELLLRIYTAVDGLEVSLDTLNLTADSVNLNVDGLETLLTDIKAKLTELDAAFDAEDFSSETTLAALLSAFNAEDFSSETTLAAFKAEQKTEADETQTAITTADTNITAAVDAATAALTAANFANPLSQFLGFRVPDGSEVRTDLGTTDLYLGFAPDGTAESAASWTVVRAYLTAGSPVRFRSRTAVAWDSRTTGW